VIGAGADPEGVADAICAHVKANAQAGDVVAILSNGGFGGLHRRLLAALGEAV
jgi:UDP-N-acetylmuramate: L-alanyl-gamma-D-glutamyl-meso-diaminopimelate ligase